MLALLSVFCLACPPKQQTVKQGDSLASVGDWETALAQYQQALREKPDDLAVKKKIEEAQPKVVEIWTKRGIDANATGNVGDAGDLWRRAIELVPEVPEGGRKASAPWGQIEQNASALEYFGETALAEDREQDALHAYAALALVFPDKTQFVDKHNEATRKFAASLAEEADGLWKRNLPGASLVVVLRALQYDPLQPRAFANGAELKKTLRKRTKVELNGAKVVEGGFKGLGNALEKKINPKLDDFPPYGPFKDAPVKATFVVTVEAFEKDEIVEEGVDDMPNTLAPSMDPVPNPAVEEQKAKIVRVEKKLAELNAKMKADIAAKKAKAKAKASSGKKSAAPKPANPGDAGLQVARDLDKTRVDLASAKARLEQLPLTIIPPPPDPTWKLPWVKTIRWVETRVRFEIQEPDFAEAITSSVVHKVEKGDRAHKGNETQGVGPDKLELASFEDLTAELAEKVAAEAASVMEKARNRRIAALLERGQQQEKAGDEAEAHDAYMRLLFTVGPDALPADAAKSLAKALDHDRFKEIVAAQQ